MNIINFFIQNPKILIELIIILIITIILKLSYPKFRGFMGEFWLRKELEKLSKDKYFLLNNIMIKDNNKTHQIDHIVLSEYGIFVIEMKNYFSYITGNKYDLKWCQHLGKYKNYFQNPFHQNYGHIKSLANILNLNENLFLSVVCFSNQARLDKKVKTIVTQLDNINDYILNYKEKKVNLDISNLYFQISNLNIREKRIHKQHVKNIQKNLQEKKIKIKEGICPECGFPLIEKMGRYGTFIGCSNFPKCKYIKR